jgi:hypothetical protein
MAPEIIRNCSDQFPFVLLPVRLETKYRTSAAGTELRIRFYPDSIGVAAKPVDVNEAERALGQSYWRARAAFHQAPGDEGLKRTYQGAWRALATGAGAYRAGIVVRNTAPLNPDAPPDLLSFPPPSAAGPALPPRAESLPDAFVVIAYFRDPTTRAQSEVARVTGAAIPADLVLGPDPTQSALSMSRDPATGRLVVPEPLRWLTDFDAAERVGMAVRMPVPAPFDTRGFDRIVAVGVKARSSFPTGAGVLGELFQKHRDTDGLALVRAGTPTNNTETATSGWQPAANEIDELFALEDDALEPSGGEEVLEPTDGERFADLFGLSDEALHRLPGAGATDVSEAFHFNRATAPGTVGDFMREYLKGWVDTPTADAVHDFFTSRVSGRGQFPAFRVGRQPYGIILTSAWDAWKEQGIALPSSAVDVTQRILRLLIRHRPRWEVLADRAPHAALPTADPFQRLLGILGLLASSTDFVSRKAVSDEFIHQRLQFAGAQAPATQAWLDNLNQTRAGEFNSIDLPPVPSPGDPLLAFLVFLDQFDEWKLPLVDGDPTKPLRNSLAGQVRRNPHLSGLADVGFLRGALRPSLQGRLGERNPAAERAPLRVAAAIAPGRARDRLAERGQRAGDIRCAGPRSTHCEHRRSAKRPPQGLPEPGRVPSRPRRAAGRVGGLGVAGVPGKQRRECSACPARGRSPTVDRRAVDVADGAPGEAPG